MMTNEDRSKIDQHLAWCVCRIRATTVPDAPWDQRGIAAAMAEVQHREPHEVFAGFGCVQMIRSLEWIS